MTAKQFVEELKAGKWHGPVHDTNHGCTLLDRDNKVIAIFPSMEDLSKFCRRVSKEIKRRMLAGESFK